MTVKDFEKIIELGRIIRVKKYLKDEWKHKYATYKPIKVSDELKHEVRRVWGKVTPDLFQIEWYNHLNSSTLPPPAAGYQYNGQCNPNYLTDSIYYGIVDLFYNNYTACRYIDNKNLYDLLFHDVKCPNTVLRKINGVMMDSEYKLIDDESAYSIFEGLNEGIIIKPSVLSVGGHGIKVLPKGTEKATFTKELKKLNNCVVQELVRQHESMAYLHKNSVNTVRIVTWVRANGKVEVLNAIVRMGVGGSVVDNASSGGIFCGVKEDGWLKGVAFNTSGKRFDKHPQGAEFDKVQIPNYDRFIELVKELAPRMLPTSRLVSWDLAVGEDGLPLLIEANLAYGELDFHQITKGPLFGEYTSEMIEEVFSNKKNALMSKLL